MSGALQYLSDFPHSVGESSVGTSKVLAGIHVPSAGRSTGGSWLSTEGRVVLSHTVLIVDDSPLIRHSLRACLEQNIDWEVCGEAENGQIAVEKVKVLHPDVVILDLQMPVMNGMEAARLISGIAPGTAMVMFTIHGSEQLRKDARAAGVRDVLSKAERFPDCLLASLRSICNEH